MFLGFFILSPARGKQSQPRLESKPGVVWRPEETEWSNEARALFMLRRGHGPYDFWKSGLPVYEYEVPSPTNYIVNSC
jgi:hypothetical protein